MKKQLLLFLMFLFLASGCSAVVNSHLQKKEMMSAYLSGNVTGVEKKLNGELSGFWFSAVGRGDELMWRLEAGGYHFLRGRDKESFAEFEKAQALIEDFDSRAMVNLRQAGAEGATLLTNPNALPYRGLCRDRVLFPVYKALACLGMGNEAGFRVELFHLREVQDKVMEDYRKYFAEEEKAMAKEKEKNSSAAACADIDKVLSNSSNKELAAAIEGTKNVANKGYGNFLNPFTIFMSGYGYLRDGNPQNAIVDFQRLCKAMPDHPLIRRYYASVARLARKELPPELKKIKPFDFPLDRENILVIFANGRSAAFRQQSLYIPVYVPGYFTLASAAWPLCEYYDAPFSALEVSAGSQLYRSMPVADMDGILAQEYKERLPGMLTRLILSTAAKEVASYFAVTAAQHANCAAGVAAAIGTSACKAAFNTADTRSWEILPKEYQIVQLPMPEKRSVTLSLPGIAARRIKFSSGTKSAIIFVNAPSKNPAAVSCRVLEIRSK